MNKNSFRKPESYKKEVAKAVVSSRVSQNCKNTLEWAAKSAELGVSELISGVLEDYCDWLQKEYMKSGRKAAEVYK